MLGEINQVANQTDMPNSTSFLVMTRTRWHDGATVFRSPTKTTTFLTVSSAAPCGCAGGFGKSTSRLPTENQICTSWWFQPSWKMLVKMGIFPRVRGENKTYLKPPPSIYVLGSFSTPYIKDKLIPPLMTGILINGYINPLLMWLLTIPTIGTPHESWSLRPSHVGENKSLERLAELRLTLGIVMSRQKPKKMYPL